MLSLRLALALLAVPLCSAGGGWNFAGVSFEEDGSMSDGAGLPAFQAELHRYAARAGASSSLEEHGPWAALRQLGASLGLGGGAAAGRPLGLRDLGALRALTELSLLDLTLSAESRQLRIGNRSDWQRGTGEWYQALANEMRDLAAALPGERLTIGAGFVALYWVMLTSIRADPDGKARMEGFASLTQAWWLSRQAMPASVRRICEIGFNGGHSALAMLLGAPRGASLVSFDIGSKSYTPASAGFLEMVFPDRFQLVLGDSAVTVPQYAFERYGDARCDLVYIDGGHEEEEATRDLLSMSLLAKHGHTLVVMDDVRCDEKFCAGPTAAWDKFKHAGRLTELGCETSEPFRGWCWGLFI